MPIYMAYATPDLSDHIQSIAVLWHYTTDYGISSEIAVVYAHETLDARRPCISRGSCTCLEQSSTSRQGCDITSVVPEPPEDMAF